MKLSVVMPAYNERKTIREIVQRVLAVPIEKEIIIVDDGSTDGTRDILRRARRPDGVRVRASSRRTRARARPSARDSPRPPATS